MAAGLGSRQVEVEPVRPLLAQELATGRLHRLVEQLGIGADDLRQAGQALAEAGRDLLQAGEYLVAQPGCGKKGRLRWLGIAQGGKAARVAVGASESGGQRGGFGKKERRAEQKGARFGRAGALPRGARDPGNSGPKGRERGQDSPGTRPWPKGARFGPGAKGKGGAIRATGFPGFGIRPGVWCAPKGGKWPGGGHFCGDKGGHRGAQRKGVKGENAPGGEGFFQEGGKTPSVGGNTRGRGQNFRGPGFQTGKIRESPPGAFWGQGGTAKKMWGGPHRRPGQKISGGGPPKRPWVAPERWCWGPQWVVQGGPTPKNVGRGQSPGFATQGFRGKRCCSQKLGGPGRV